MKTYLVLDLETVDDPDLPPPPPKKDDEGKSTPRRGPPPPVHCSIVCAGYAWVSHEPRAAARLGGTAEWTISFEMLDAMRDMSERKLLRELSDCLTEVDPVLVTYGGHNFDGPVVAARSFRLGVPLPWYYDAPSPRRSARYRYSPEKHLDLCDELSDFSFRKSGLAVMGRACGMPGKYDVEADGVAELVARGERQRVVDYCLGDVAMTVAVFFRRLLVTGAVDLESYREGCRALLAAMNAEPRLSEFVLRVEVDRLMLSSAEAQDAADEAGYEDPPALGQGDDDEETEAAE